MSAPNRRRPEDIPLQVVYEDDSLIVIDKPAGLVVHPGSGNWSGTLLNALLFHAPQLDKGAAGRHRASARQGYQWADGRRQDARGADRSGQAVAGALRQALLSGAGARHRRASGTVDAPIGRHPTLRTSMAVVRTASRRARTTGSWSSFATCTLIECALETGRTHQIRVHMTAIGHPLVGDPTYGSGCQPRAAGTVVFLARRCTRVAWR
jgi:23S rRNA pseudouridine1911/1915/1917 synthase